MPPDSQREMLIVLSSGNPHTEKKLLKLNRWHLFDRYYLLLVNKLNEIIEHTEQLKYINNQSDGGKNVVLE